MSSPGATRTGTGLTPALVVVDSRNIFHQTEAATGFRELPTVEGVVDAMQDYGFDALEVHVGLALPRSQDAARLSAAKKTNEAFKNRIESSQRGGVLLGELHVKDKKGGGYVSEEKQVDVACAVDICRHATLIARHESQFKAIVVLSQDTDLSPALKYAEEVHVPVVIAAHDRVERRGFPHLMLTERAFRKMARISAPLNGHALRAAVASAVMAPDSWSDWTVVGPDPTRERWLVTNATGLRGVVRKDHLDQMGCATAGAVVRLRVADVDFGRRRGSFPFVTCTPKGPRPGFNHRDQFEVRTVTGRRAVTEVMLDKPVFGKNRLRYPPGGMEKGTEVLIDIREPQRPAIVGPLSLPTNRDLCQARPISVYPFKEISPTTTSAHSATHGRLLIAHSAQEPPTLNVRYAAVLVGGTRVAKLISTPLA